MVMSAEWSKQYNLIESNESSEGALSIWYSEGNNDIVWDEFLKKTPMGQFQQSSMWAQVKEAEGWKCLRVVAASEDQIVGGFQILWRNVYLCRIGYVSKGPVAVPETKNLIERLVPLMIEQARLKKIHALIVQPPDDSNITSDILDRACFIRSNPMGVIETTLLVDLSKGIDALNKGMSKKTKKYVRIAKSRGVVIREGIENDIGLFFHLMSETCKRQGVKPTPPTEEALRQLWLRCARHDCLRVTFAEYNQEVLAGRLNIIFGNKISGWKKGWNQRYCDCYPNDLLYYETLQWACSRNYSHCDVVAFDRSIAHALLNGKPLSETQEKSRNIFHLRFGGVPKFLPSARIWIANPLIHQIYKKILTRFVRFR